MKILVAIDFSESTEKILQKAEEIAKRLSSKLWIIHVAEPEPDFVGYGVDPQILRDTHSNKFHDEHRQIQEISERMRKNGLDATALLVQGSTADTILKEATKLNVDIIILGSHGHGSLYQILVGSVSEGVLQKSECPVLIIPTHDRS